MTRTARYSSTTITCDSGESVWVGFLTAKERVGGADGVESGLELSCQVAVD
jgi:hypothetical protein